MGKEAQKCVLPLQGETGRLRLGGGLLSSVEIRVVVESTYPFSVTYTEGLVSVASTQTAGKGGSCV